MCKKLFGLLLVACVFSACGEYQKLLKSNDPELKYTKAVEYYNKKDYMRAQSLLDEVAQYYKGTDRAEDVLNYLAKSYIGQKDPISAGDYYSAYCRNYPKGRYAEEAFFMVGYCDYLQSDDARLDQTPTYNALKNLQKYIDRFPEGERVAEAYRLMDELNDKLAYKEFLSAKLYYNLGTYRGNNYEAAVIVANNALRKYPLTTYREELAFLVLASMYKQATLSVQDKQEERYREAQDEYYSYKNEFPDGKHRKEADRLHKEIEKFLKTKHTSDK